MPDIIKFQQLLDKMHSSFDSFEVVTECLQFPTEENVGLACFKATVKVHKGDKDSIYMGHGDAAKWNVGKQIVPHIFRMAETRAIVRAFKLATNVGTVSDVELGETPHAVSDTQPSPIGHSAPNGITEIGKNMKGAAKAIPSEVEPATETQIKHITRMAEDVYQRGLTALVEEFGDPAKMTTVQAADLYKKLAERKREALSTTGNDPTPNKEKS